MGIKNNALNLLMKLVSTLLVIDTGIKKKDTLTNPMQDGSRMLQNKFRL